MESAVLTRRGDASFPASQHFPQMSLHALNKIFHWEKLFAPFGSFEALKEECLFREQNSSLKGP